MAKVEWIAATEAAKVAAQKAGQPPRKVRVWIDVHGPLAAGASGYGRLRVEQLLNPAGRAETLDWQSPAAKPADGIEDSLHTIRRGVDDARGGPWFPEVIKEGVRFYVDVDAGQSIRQIGLLRGTLVLRAGGRYETLAIKNVLQHLGRPIDDPSLKALGIAVIPCDGSESPSKGSVARIAVGPDGGSGTVAQAPGGKEVLIETQWTRSPVIRIAIVDAEAGALPLPTTGTAVTTNQNTVNLWSKFRFEPPKDAQLTLVVLRDPQLVQVRFTLNEIDLSQGQWIVVPQSAADVPWSSSPSFPIPATLAEPPADLPPVKVKSSEVEILPGTVQVSKPDTAVPSAEVASPGAASSEKMKTKEGYPLGHVAGPFFAGCGTSTFRNSKNPAEPAGVTFNFNCPAEGFGEEAEPEPAGANIGISVLGPLKEEYVRSWGQVQDDLSFNLDFTYLPKEASRTVDLALLQGVRGIAGFDIQGPMQGDRLVVRGDLGLLAGQRKIRSLRLANCDVSSQMARNLAAVPNLPHLVSTQLQVRGRCPGGVGGGQIAPLFGYGRVSLRREVAFTVDVIAAGATPPDSRGYAGHRSSVRLVVGPDGDPVSRFVRHASRQPCLGGSEAVSQARGREPRGHPAQRPTDPRRGRSVSLEGDLLHASRGHREAL